jgi:lycopene beta-cyclase
MIQSGAFQNKSILLIDQDPKKTMIVLGVLARRTFDLANSQLLKMDLALFANSDFHQDLELKPYTQPNQS